jgi:hypothetical protein
MSQTTSNVESSTESQQPTPSATEGAPQSMASALKMAANDDRRDSPRLPMTFLVREQGQGAQDPWDEREGDLSLGGIYWKGKTPPRGSSVEVRFRLAGLPKEVRALGEIIRVSEQGGGIGFHVRFTELDIESELNLARYLHERVAGAKQG